MQQAFARMRTGKRGKLPGPVEDIDAEIGTPVRRAVDQMLRVSAVGSAETVKRQLAEMIQAYQPDEIILTGQIHDHDARLRSFEIAAGVMADLTGDQDAQLAGAASR
jgi:alkanesulfonate monooxygenase SsuD/methylene tetrahydromethanopterin reductase-like flavin-dependent oxidoreductase (luciferase family)